MAEFVHQYVGAMLQRQQWLAENMPDVIGTGIMQSSRGDYNINLMTLLFMGAIMKVISDVAPQVTDEVWLARLDSAIDGQWPDWIINQDRNAMPPL